MDNNHILFTLPFTDTENGGISFSVKNKEGELYDELQQTIPSGSLLGADVLDQFFSDDDPLDQPNLNGPTTLHCEICRKKFDNIKKYYGHLRVHTKDNLWTCDKCPDQKFATKQQLMKHCLTHKPLERVWQCPQCSSSFEALWRLQQHFFASHSVCRPHKCTSCPKSFQKFSDLQKHVSAVHAKNENKNKFLCTVCSRLFSDKSNLSRHMLTHTKEKPYCCPRCGRRYQQLTSQRRHLSKCQSTRNPTWVTAETVKPARQNHCRVCGATFKYKSALLEHCVRQHTVFSEKDKDDKQSQSNTESKTVSTIVDDLLSVEDEYSIVNKQTTMTSQTEILNVIKKEAERNAHQEHEFFNQLTGLYEDLLNDIDFESLQNSQVFNPEDYTKHDEIFNMTNSEQILDRELMDVLYNDKIQLPDEVLNANEMNQRYSENNEMLAPVAVNECSTIFESDVDLDASTNLAANLNQLIGENNVQYISTEDDDTFIISLDNAVDAEKLTDMLNIIELNKSDSTKVDIANVSDKSTDDKPSDKDDGASNAENKDNKIKNTKIKKPKVVYVCQTCMKIFSKKDNYWSHVGTHYPSLRRHSCKLCKANFSYRSSLNKHVASCHQPRVHQDHPCTRCDQHFSAAWKLKTHIERDHEGLTPYACDVRECHKSFYKHSDLVVHMRSHTGERPFECQVCSKRFLTNGQRQRHLRGQSHKVEMKNKIPEVAAQTIVQANKSPEVTAQKIIQVNKIPKVAAQNIIQVNKIPKVAAQNIIQVNKSPELAAQKIIQVNNSPDVTAQKIIEVNNISKAQSIIQVNNSSAVTDHEIIQVYNYKGEAYQEIIKKNEIICDGTVTGVFIQLS